MLGATDAVVAASLHDNDNEAGPFALSDVERLASQAFDHPDYAPIRSLTLRRLEAYLDDSWGNDQSSLPAACAASVGNLTKAWIRTRAFEDVDAGLASLGKIALRALATRRKHIGYAATSQLADVFPLLASESHDTLRDRYLRTWSGEVEPLFRAAPLEPVDGMSGVVDALLPGITLARGSSLQQAMWQVPASTTSDAVGSILGALEPAVASLEATIGSDSRKYETALEESLSLVYGVSVLRARDADATEATEQGARVLRTVMDVGSSEPGRTALAHTDALELAWSILLATSYINVEDSAMIQAAEALLAALSPDADWSSRPGETYAIAAVTGLKVIVGESESDIDAWIRAVFEHEKRREALGGPYWAWGRHIAGLGRAPSANRNRIAAPPALVDAINAGAVERWPLLNKPCFFYRTDD